MKIKKNDKVLLLSEDESHLVTVAKNKLNVKSGIIDLGKLIGKDYGSSVKTHIGKKFILVKPTLRDVMKKLTRGAQVILPKDASLIIAYTGAPIDGLVVDAGAGSGFLSIFLGNYLAKGKVVAYEKDKRFVKIVEKNIKISGLKNVKLKNKDISKGIDEKNVDLITLDLQYPERIIKRAYNALSVGGWMVVYSPTIDGMTRVVKEIKKYFSETNIVENIVREWQSERTIRPKTMGLMHTGWLIFSRKLL